MRVWLLYLPGPGPWLMSWLRRRWVIFRNPNAHIEFQGPVYLGPRFSLHAPTAARSSSARGVEFRRGFRAELGPTARISIGGGARLHLRRADAVRHDDRHRRALHVRPVHAASSTATTATAT